MGLISYKRGQGSIILRVKILDSSASTGAGLAGLTSASAGLIVSTIADNEATATTYTQAGSTIETISTLGTYAAPTATKCRFKEVDSTNHKGVYEIQIADARYAVSSAKSLLVSILGATNAAETDCVIPLRDLDPYDAVRGGMTALPAAVPGAAGGVFIAGTNAATTLATLTVSGATSLQGVAMTTLATSGTTTLNALTVTNAATLGSLVVSGTTDLTGAVQLGATLGVTGAVTLSSTLGVGAVTFASAAITGALSVGTTTTLTGAVSFGAAFGVTGATTLASLVVSGTTALTGAVSAPAGITADITGNLSGSVGTLSTWHASVTDWTDGGRLDLILDDIDAEVDEIHTAVHNITVTGSALNVIAEAPAVAQPATGTESSGTWASTNLHDGVYHVITAASNEIDIYYQFPVPTTGAPVSVNITGYLKEGVPPGQDTIDAYAYNFVSLGWDKITDAIFTGITTDGPAEEKSIVLFGRHAEAGVCRIRFQATSLEATTTLNIDQIYVSYAETVAASVALILEDTGELRTNQGAWATATSVTVSDKTGFALANTGADLVLKSSTFALAMADAVWDELLSGHAAEGMAGTYVAENAGNVWGFAYRTLSDYSTGVGFSAIPWNSAWDAEVQSEVADALTAYDAPTNTQLNARTLVAANYFDPTADAVANVTLTATTTTLTNKTGFGLAATGLDSIAATAPSGVATTFPQKLVQLWNRFFGKATMTDALLTTYDEAGTTAATEQILSDDATTQTQGKATDA